MAMDLTGASLTTSEVRAISADIEQIGKNIDSTMQSVKSIMNTVTGQSEGGLIDQTTTAVEQLNDLCTKLVACIFNDNAESGSGSSGDLETFNRIKSSLIFDGISEGRKEHGGSNKNSGR